MSLYHEAAEILTRARAPDGQKDHVSGGGGSLKSIVFGPKQTWKNDARTLLALTAETAKWSEILAEVLDKSGVLGLERNLTPTLALLLAHDLLLSKKGVALPSSHGLSLAISRHKARLSAELTKLRIRRGFGSLDTLRSHVQSISTAVTAGDTQHPRWIRVNSLKSSTKQELDSTFAEYTRTDNLAEVIRASPGSRVVHIDVHIPNLLAITNADDPTRFKAYKEGRLILQEKASCFPAYLLDPCPGEGDVIDACAAPGNKTTHVAAILSADGSGVRDDDVPRRRHVTACERDVERSKTLTKMVRLAGAQDLVTTKSSQDFLRLDPHVKEFANVTSLLLDPSCSGSGIFGRDEVTVTVHLPQASSSQVSSASAKSKKRKREPRDAGEDKVTIKAAPASVVVDETQEEESPSLELQGEKLEARLEALSKFQLRLLLRAMSFPAARRITYSTCSIHATENENVVVQALISDVALECGWRILKRHDQVEGLRKWPLRGTADAVQSTLTASDGVVPLNVQEVAEGCVRCEKGGEHGTMGFFVAGFVRDNHHAQSAKAPSICGTNGSVRSSFSPAVYNAPKPGPETKSTSSKYEEEWGGFSDEEEA